MTDNDPPLVDVDTLMALTRQLRELRDRVERSKVSAEQRSRWQRALAAIAEGASKDLDRAQQQLTRLVAQLDRVAGT